MKKIYMTPATNVMKLETVLLTTASLTMNTESTDEVVTEQTELLSRENHSIWDEEEYLAGDAPQRASAPPPKWIMDNG